MAIYFTSVENEQLPMSVKVQFSLDVLGKTFIFRV